MIRNAFLLLLTLMLSSVAEVALAHTEDHYQDAKVGTAQKVQGKVGLEERLGAKLPLDTIFRDESGKSVRLRELVTGPTIIIPVYYGCTNVCTYLQGGLAAVLPALKARPAADYRIISLSIDETETPELALRTKKMHLREIIPPVPDDGWRFLTGDAGSIRSVTDSAGYHFQRRGHDFVHPVASIVITRDGTIVRYLYGTSFLAKDVSLALLEARDGKVGATVRRVVDFCFSFDPTSRGYELNLLRISATVIALCCGGFLLFLIATGKRKPEKKKVKR